MKTLHPRYFIVQKAENELHTFFIDLTEKHDLTFGEMTKILSSLLQTTAKYAIRYERHPDDDKRGDEE